MAALKTVHFGPRAFRTALLAGLAVLAALGGGPSGPAGAQAQQGDDAAPRVDAVPPAEATPPPPVRLNRDEMRAILAASGNFVQHAKYGEVWVPTMTPPGWHPYPPCNWVNTKLYGWYFRDASPWGRIVHHYGRWARDDQMGWIWVPGKEFSPGWVLWRTSAQWVGWAPMSPDQDIASDQGVQAASPDPINGSDAWIFMDLAKFTRGCDGTTAPAADVPQILRQTTYVTRIAYTRDIVIFVLPGYVTGPLVDIKVVFDPWPAAFLSKVVVGWNWLWHHTLIFDAQVCTPANPH